MFPVILVLRADKAETNKQKKKNKTENQSPSQVSVKTECFLYIFYNLTICLCRHSIWLCESVRTKPQNKADKSLMYELY